MDRYAYPEEADINFSVTNGSNYITSPEIAIQQQHAKMFAVRDNSRFQSTPNLASINFYDSGYTSGRISNEGVHYVRQNDGYSDSLQPPGGSTMGRPLSPRRIM